MRILSAKDIHRLAENVNFANVIEKAADKAEGNNFLMPERQQLAHKENTHLFMPVYGNKYFSTSLLSVFPGNSQKTKEAIQGVISLNDGETGEPVCLLNGPAVNGLRAGAVSACGIRHLAPSEAAVLGIVGAGSQGYYQGISILKEKTFNKVLLFDTDLWRAEQMVEKLKQETKVSDISVADDIMNLVTESHIVVTVTNSAKAVLPDDKVLLHGKTFIATGSFKPNMVELPKALFRHLKKCVVDSRTALRESGDLIEPIINSNLHIDNVITLGQLVETKEPVDMGQTRLLKTVGEAIHDLYIASELFNMAIKNDMGHEINF
ncbi:MAG: hypothetical protein K9J27_08670 [Bacteroidales bacterium]|nr:hypothetical protein [Bacteroidales bacterium]